MSQATLPKELSPVVTELLHVLELGIEMRKIQRLYFKERDFRVLREAQQAERAFDKAAKAALDDVTQAAGQGKLLP